MTMICAETAQIMPVTRNGGFTITAKVDHGAQALFDHACSLPMPSRTRRAIAEVAEAVRLDPVAQCTCRARPGLRA
jgi:hypothetical protein